MTTDKLRARLNRADQELDAAKACHFYASVRSLSHQVEDLREQLEEAVKAMSLKERLAEDF